MRISGISSRSAVYEFKKQKCGCLCCPHLYRGGDDRLIHAHKGVRASNGLCGTMIAHDGSAVTTVRMARVRENGQ